MLSERADVPPKVALTVDHLRNIGELMVSRGEYAHSDKPDRRLLIAATEQVAVKWWQEFGEGKEWLEEVLRSCRELEGRMVDPGWLEAREPLSRSKRPSRAMQSLDPEAHDQARDPLEAEETDVSVQTSQTKGSVEGAVDSWVRRLREDAIGDRRSILSAGTNRRLWEPKAAAS